MPNPYSGLLTGGSQSTAKSSVYKPYGNTTFKKPKKKPETIQANQSLVSGALDSARIASDPKQTIKIANKLKKQEIERKRQETEQRAVAIASGVVHGTKGDFFASFNERLLGGLGRGVVRGAEWLIPGNQKAGADNIIKKVAPEKGGLATNADPNSVGGRIGTIAKGAVDVASMVLPSTAATRAVQGVGAIQNLAKGGRVAKLASKVIPEVIGGIPATGTYVAQQRGMGNEVDLKKELATGAGIDLLTPPLLDAAGKVIGKGIKGVKSLVKNAQAPKETPKLPKLDKAKADIKEKPTTIKPLAKTEIKTKETAQEPTQLEPLVKKPTNLMDESKTYVSFKPTKATEVKLTKSVRDVSYPGKKRILQEVEGNIDGKFLGIRFYEDGNAVRVIGFSSETKNKGYGTKLLNNLIDDAKASGKTKVIADDVRATDSAKYWEKQGFKVNIDNNEAVLNIKPYTNSQFKEGKQLPSLPESRQKIVKKQVPKITRVSTVGTSKLAKGVRSKAIKNKLIYGFDKKFQDLPEYTKVDMKDQGKKAVDLVLNNPREAIDVAMGRKQPPQGILPESVFVAVEDYAIATKDVDLLRELATSSELTKEATLMGQRIRTLAERNPDSAVSGIKQVRDARVKSFEGRSKAKVNKAIRNEAKAIKTRVKVPSKVDWNAFVESIRC